MEVWKRNCFFRVQLGDIIVFQVNFPECIVALLKTSATLIKMEK